MYDRADTMWLYEYYSGLPRKVIADRLLRSENAVHGRVKALGLPVRPRGGLCSDRARDEWLQRPEIKALRDKYVPDAPPLVPQ